MNNQFLFDGWSFDIVESHKDYTIVEKENALYKFDKRSRTLIKHEIKRVKSNQMYGRKWRK